MYLCVAKIDQAGKLLQVKVAEVNYVAAPPSHVLDSQISKNPKTKTGYYLFYVSSSLLVVNMNPR